MPRLRLIIEFHGNTAMLAWTIRKIIDALHSSPVDMTVSIERVENET